MVNETSPAAGAERARAVAGAVPDPELPMLTLADLGILREVRIGGDGSVTVWLTPTYSGCPALPEMCADVRRRLTEAGYEQVEVRTALSPPWSSDRVTEQGRRKLAEHGIAPPGPAPDTGGPVPLVLSPARRAVRCPRCGSPDTREVSRFGATSCKALHRCRACREPFEHFKEI